MGLGLSLDSGLTSTTGTSCRIDIKTQPSLLPSSSSVGRRQLLNKPLPTSPSPQWMTTTILYFTSKSSKLFFISPQSCIGSQNNQQTPDNVSTTLPDSYYDYNTTCVKHGALLRRAFCNFLCGILRNFFDLRNYHRLEIY